MIYRWRTALSAGLVLGVVFGSVEGFSIFALAFADSLHVTRSTTSAMFASYLLATVVLAPVVGIAIDRWGTRPLILVSFPVLSVTLAACGTVSSIWQLFLLYDTLIAASTISLISSAQVMVKNSYDLDRGKAVGVTYACLGLGDFILFTFFGSVVGFSGWRTAYFIAAGVVASAWLLFLRITGRQDQVTPPTLPSKVGAGSSASANWAALLAVCVAAFMSNIADFVVFQHVVPYLVTAGYSNALAGAMLGIVSLGYAAGQLTAGALSDRASRESVGSAAAILLVFAVTALWFAESRQAAVFASVAALGVSVGGIVGSGSAAVGDLFAGVRLGRMSAFVQVGGASGAAFGAWFGGFGYDLTGGYAITFVLASAAALAWMSAIWVAAPRHARLAPPPVADPVPVSDQGV